MSEHGERVNESSKDDALIKRRKIAMLQADITGLEIADRLGISKQAVSQVVNGKRQTLEVQRAIAEACGEPLEALFPPKQNEVEANAA